MLVNTNQFFKCETCTHSRVNGCDTFCDTEESYHPSIQKLMPINDGDFLMREEVIQEVLSQMAISSSPEAMRTRLLNLQGVSIQKHGEWKQTYRIEKIRYSCDDIETFKVPDGYCCSICSRRIKVKENYCPNCGAKMDGKRKEA